MASEEVVLGRGETELSKRIPESKRIDAVLDLVGNSTIMDSWAC